MRAAMKEFTQTNTWPGNCWQTAIACILEIDPADMPQQLDFERPGPDGRVEGSYSPHLNAFLRKHYGLVYASLWENQWPAVMPREPGWHTMHGPTVRTAEHGRIHVVVGRYGEMVWDPHPTHAGLIAVDSWGLLAPFPAKWEESWAKNGVECACRACGTPSESATVGDKR